jgi:acyl-coenzyme A synthetase/AMP-(fatty) acid ligase
VNEVVAPHIGQSPLGAAALHLSRPAVIGTAGVSTWRQVHAASIALAARLGPKSTVCNLCDSRLGFLVTWLAALRRCCFQLLPPSGGRADLLAMLKSCADPCILVDDAGAVRPEWRDHAGCIVWRPGSELGRVDDDALAWSPDQDAELVRLYTSGTTGTPEPQVKTLGQLARGARVLGARLDEELDGGVAALRSIVCSVPPQHMFGIEASVMLSLVHGIPIVEGRPLLPADVRAAFETCADGTAWITTPLHLRSLQRAGESLPHCGAVIASTMPLAASLASDVERLAAAPVLEIYGSTETGAIGMRRTARDACWRPLPGVRLEPVDDGTRVWGLHFASPQGLADHTALDDAGNFSLLGRQADLIKIGGRRASLAGLNQLLQELPGLTDGVFYLPASDSATERLVLIHAGDPLDRAAAEAWLRERMDPVFLPRVFIHVDRLPRAGAGKVPRAALDEIYAAWRTERAAP